MSQVNINQTNIPNLYSFYGKQYNYNDLAQAADQGLMDYLATLKRGEKDQEEFQRAYSDIMSGIKDGTITFDDGRFHDSEGRYTNASKKNKDYYGLMANYIYGKMGKSDVYEAPKDASKLDFDASNVRTALMRQLFNSDTGNIQDFLDLDAEKDGVRGITNRASYLSNALQAVADNWDNTFQGYQDADKSRYVSLLTNAAQALRDGKIDPGDYLALSKAVGGMDFREMMTTGQPTQAATQQSVQQQPTAQQAVQATQQTASLKTKHASLNDSSYDTNTISRMASIMNRVPDKGLINILRNSCYNRYYKFGKDKRIATLFGSSNISSKAGVTATLYAMQAHGLLVKADPKNENLYYIRGLKTKQGTGWLWDKTQNTITEVPISQIPIFQQVASHKQGGILKMQSGGTSPQQPFYSGLTDYDPNKYTREWGETQYGMNAKGDFLSTPFTTGGAGYGKDKYTTDSNFRNFNQQGRDAALAIENSQNYKNQTDKILSDYDAYNNAQDKSVFNDKNNLFLRYTHGYDSQQSNDNNKFWNNGQLRISWGPSGKNYYGKTGTTVTNVRDRIINLRNDQQVSIGHNNYRANGKRYFYKDDKGVQHWVDPEVANSGKYALSKDGIKTAVGDTDWTDYEITGLNNQNQDSDQSNQNNGTDINRTDGTQKPNWFQKNGTKLIQDLAPQAIALGRLASSIRTNNKIAKTMKDATKPSLRDTYELYSPVTGAFSEMQLRNRQAADLRRQANENATSDSQVNTAMSLDANRQANELERQGFLADDQEIKRTSQEALKRQEDNTARRSQVANYNRDAIIQNRKNIAEIEAQRQNANYVSKNNYLSGIENELRQKNAQRDYDRRLEMAENKQRKFQLDVQDLQRPFDVELQQLKTKYDDAVKDAQVAYNAKLTAWQASHGADADYTNEQFYKDYIAQVRAKRDEYYKAQQDIANRQSTSTRNFISGLQDKMNQSSLFAKRGGKLSYNSISLLNKIIQ